MAKLRMDKSELREMAVKLLSRYGVPEEDAVVVADSLIDADARGISSHGFMRLVPYIDRLKKGLVNPKPEIRTERIGCLLRVDGDNGLGQIVGLSALNSCMGLADELGGAFAFIRSSNHYGALGYYTRLAARRGYAAIATSNAGPSMPPYGGMEPMLGTNPFSISFPGGKYGDFTIDAATSAAAKGKIRVYAREGKEIPLGWAMDVDGNDTTDAEKAVLGGLLPMGWHKGYGLAMATDLLTGPLSGGKFSCESESMYGGSAVAGTGHFFWVVRIDKLMDEKLFEARAEAWFDTLKTSPKRPGVDEILIPGEIENRLFEKAGDAVEIPKSVIEDIKRALCEGGCSEC